MCVYVCVWKKVLLINVMSGSVAQRVCMCVCECIYVCACCVHGVCVCARMRMHACKYACL